MRFIWELREHYDTFEYEANRIYLPNVGLFRNQSVAIKPHATAPRPSFSART